MYSVLELTRSECGLVLVSSFYLRTPSILGEVSGTPLYERASNPIGALRPSISRSYLLDMLVKKEADTDTVVLSAAVQ